MDWHVRIVRGREEVLRLGVRGPLRVCLVVLLATAVDADGGQEWVEEARLDASGGPVSLDDERLIISRFVASFCDPCAALVADVFERRDGEWTPVGTVTDPDWIGPGTFADISLDGDRAMIAFFPAVYVFERQRSGEWKRTAKLTTGFRHDGDSVALDGDRALISSNREGAVYVFELRAGAWEQVATMPAGAGPVFLDGDRALFGGESSSGFVAQVFERRGNDWIEAARLPPNGDPFRNSRGLDLDGDHVLLHVDGEARVFERDGRWLEQATIAPSGIVGALDGDSLVTGSYVADDGSRHPHVVFEKRGNAWVEVQALTTSDGWVPPRRSVSLDSGRIAIHGQPDGLEGFRVYIFSRRPAFRRGDTDGDGEVDVTDAVSVLNWLFLSGPAPGCVAVADTNGDGGVNLTDGVWLLSYLFLSGPPPEAPFPDCGIGVDADYEEPLGCGSSPVVCR